LKAADVGLAMNIAGTDIAKEASDIVIMDDNFASIVKAVMCGRSVRQNIQKFLQFQLTINLVALAIVFVAAASGWGQPLTPVELLWLNIVADSAAALALATERPSDDLLKGKPAGRTERILTPNMWRNVTFNVLYQLLILLMIMFGGDKIFGLEDDGVDIHTQPSVRYTVLFNTFVFMQIFNEFNARRLDNKWNAFEKVFGNAMFWGIVIGTAICQFLLVEFGSNAVGVKRIGIEEWVISVLLGSTMLILGVVVRTLVPAPDWDWLKYQKIEVDPEAPLDKEARRNKFREQEKPPLAPPPSEVDLKLSSEL